MDENIGRVDKEAIIRALQEAMGDSTRPRLRPKGLGESGKTISDADRDRVKRMMGRIPPVGKGLGEAGKTLSDSDMKILQQMMLRQQGLREAEERKAFPPASMMNGGGVAVAKKRKKPKKGCVMKGRGGSYKGIR
tara:strand:+ start:70 stop:474 length:405 start_codon:yes stop_codon:yes gene_type:complete